MKLRLWLVLGLAGTFACGTTEAGGVSSSRKDGGVRRDAGSRDDDDDDDNANDDEDDAPVVRRDSGVSRVDAGGDTGPDTCEQFSVPARANAPDILIVLDRSGSMQSGGRWNPSVSAIKQITSKLESAVSFGLMLYPEPGPSLGIFGTDANGPCGAGKVNIPFKLGNAATIAMQLNQSPPGDRSATPTAASITAAGDVVITPACADCPKKEKFVVLVTDGQPNCGSGNTTTSTPADVQATVAAIQAIAEQGVKTYVVGYGTKTDRALAATMDSFAKAGDTGQHFAVENEATFVEELTKIAGKVVSCEYELDKEVDDPRYVRVAIDGISFDYQTDWTLEDKKRVILTGAACDTLRDAQTHNLEITVECTPVQVL